MGFTTKYGKYFRKHAFIRYQFKILSTFLGFERAEKGAEMRTTDRCWFMNRIWQGSVYYQVCGSRKLRRDLLLESVTKARRGWNGYIVASSKLAGSWVFVGLWLEPVTSGLRRTPTNVMARELALSP